MTNFVRHGSSKITYNAYVGFCPRLVILSVVEGSRGNETSLYIRHFTSFRYREIATPNKSTRNDNMVICLFLLIIHYYLSKATNLWLFSNILRVCSGWRQRFDS